MRQVSVKGIGMTRFGKHEGSIKKLAVEASRQALKDAGYPKVDAVYVGNFMGGSLAGQEILGSMLANELGLGPVPAAKVEGACASGGIAFRQAYHLIASGVYERVLVVGVEKMTHGSIEQITGAINTAMDNDSNEGLAGLTFPGFFGVVANRYFHECGASKEHLARVALKNRTYALENPLAQFRKPTSLEEIMAARAITDPLGLFDCSPVTDGAAAIVLGVGGEGVRVLASGQASGPPLMQEIPDLLRIPAIGEAARQAYGLAGLGPDDVDVVEVHDCFSMTELITVEELGLAEKGRGWVALEEGRFSHGGKVPVNTSGGLLSRGHPIGATGLAQIYQVVSQLRGTACNQVEGARIGLAQNLGGTGAYSTVHIFEGGKTS